jgi:uncharacterized protein (UPF0548 family)
MGRVFFGDDELMPVTVMPAALARRLREADLTYPKVGATAGPLPSGYHHLRRTVAIGSGAQAFTDAAGALASWRMHERAGLHVCFCGHCPSGQRGGAFPQPGRDPDQRAMPGRLRDRRARPARLRIRNLPGHPERGEEAFVVSKQKDETVTFTLTAFSRSASPLAKATGPVSQAIQRRINSRYLRAILL